MQLRYQFLIDILFNNLAKRSLLKGEYAFRFGLNLSPNIKKNAIKI